MSLGSGLLGSAIKRRFLETCSGVAEGSLRIVCPDGSRHDFGEASPADPNLRAEYVIRDWSAVSALAARGDIGMGESYAEGLWDTPDLEALFTVVLRNMDAFEGVAHGTPFNRWKFLAVDRLLRRNSRRGSARNIRAHYDVGNDFYKLWLDETMTYSSALYAPGESDLVAAQHRKYDRLLDAVGGGAERVLEIGCGWGGFAERAAGRGHAVTGLTISPAQKAFAEARLGPQAEIRLQDYRDARGRYDAIVSIEMIEAVGERYWRTYFETLRDRLVEGGRAAIQAILVRDDLFEEYRRRSDYIRHYTFPGGMLLSTEQIRRSAESAGMKVTGVHHFGPDYARTLREWRARFDANAARIAGLGHDRAFQRSWRFYFGVCAAAFAVGRTDVAQLELTHA